MFLEVRSLEDCRDRMDMRRIGCCLLIAALCQGCRSNEFTHFWIEEMNNQNRELERIIYDQQYEIDILQKKVDDYAANGGATTRRRGDPPVRSDSKPSTSPANRGTTPLKKPPEMDPDALDLQVPMIEVPSEPGLPSIEQPMAPEPKPVPPAASAPAPAETPRATTVPERALNPASPEPATPPVRDRVPTIETPAPAPVLNSAPEPAPQPTIDPMPPRNVPRLPAPRTNLPATGTSLGPRRPAIDLSPETLPESLPPVVDELPAPQPTTVPETDTPAAAAARPAWIAPPPKPPESLSATLPSPAETLGNPEQGATQLVFNAIHTGGVNLDSRPGDDGLALLLETHNERGEFVPQVGKVSIVLLDPALEGADARVARWEFDEDAVRASQSVLAQQRGIALTMPWPTAPPQHSTLRLFVRLETADGQRLQADQELTVALPGQTSSNSISTNQSAAPAANMPAVERWTPRAAGNDHPAGEVARRPELNNSSRTVPPIATQPEPAAIQEPRRNAAPPESSSPPKPRMIMPPPALGER